MSAHLLITGATGHLGGAVIGHLLTRLPADRVAAFVRSEEKAAGLKARGVSVRVGSYDDPDLLDRAMEGIETVLLVSSTDEGDRLQQHRNVIAAAQKGGVGRVGYTGRNLRSPETLVNGLMKEHVQTERDLRASGLAYSLFRNALYLDAIPQFIGGEAAFTAGIHLPTGDGAVAYALRREQGEAIANALLDEAEGDHVYHLTGAGASTFADVARALSRLTGRQVAYTPTDEAPFAARMAARGVPTPAVEKMLGFIADIRNGQEAGVSGDLERLLGRPPVSLEVGLQEVFGL